MVHACRWSRLLGKYKYKNPHRLNGDSEPHHRKLGRPFERGRLRGWNSIFFSLCCSKFIQLTWPSSAWQLSPRYTHLFEHEAHDLNVCNPVKSTGQMNFLAPCHPTHWEGFSPPPQKNVYKLIDVGLKSLERKQNKRQNLFDLSLSRAGWRFLKLWNLIREKSEPFQSLKTLQETFNLLSVSPCDNNISDVASWNLPDYHGPKYLSYEAIQWKA